jgi:hypothetical protein
MGLSWVMAEFFILKKRKTLPSVFLALWFIASTFYLTFYLSSPSDNDRWITPKDEVFAVSILLSLFVSSLVSFGFWRRFQVPISVALSIVFCVLFIATLSLLFIDLGSSTMYAISGIVIFIIALMWDKKDLGRVKKESNVAFWLHAISATLIVNAIFPKIYIQNSAFAFLEIYILYIILSLISITIDRRVLMLSSLIYMIIAMSKMLDSFAIAGIIISSSLLISSIFWNSIRRVLLKILPAGIKNFVPPLHKKT